MQRVLWQLLVNAFANSTGKVLLQVEDREQHHRFIVKDSGENLYEGQVETILDAQDIGLGLHICQDLLGILGSQLQVQKGRKGDTQFYFELASA